MKVAAIQMISGPDVPPNLSTAATLIARAADNGAKLIALPEYFPLIGASDAARLAVRETEGAGQIQDFLATQAKQHGVHLVGGSLPLLADDARVARRHLPGDVLSDHDLALVLLAAVGVRDVYHHLLAQAGGAQQGAGGFYFSGAVVGQLAAAQDHVAVVVATGFENGGLAHFGHAYEGMRRLCGLNRVARHLHTAVGAVFEAHWARKPAGELAVALALGGARANGAPAHQIADELRAEQIEEFRAHRQAERQHVQQQLVRHLQAFVDGEAAIQVRVVDVALPSHGSARLFKVHAHHHQQIVRVPLA